MTSPESMKPKRSPRKMKLRGRKRQPHPITITVIVQQDSTGFRRVRKTIKIVPEVKR